jgi:hypothetical protein
MLAIDVRQQTRERRDLFRRLDEMQRRGKTLRYFLRVIAVIVPGSLEKRVHVHFGGECLT